MVRTEGRCYIIGGQPIPLRKGVVHFPWGPRKILGFCGERRSKEAEEGIPVRVFRPKRTSRRRRRGVMRMWKKRLYVVLRFLVCLAFWACILTIKAC